MKRYYYDDGSKTVGPLTKEELLTLDISDDTYIFDEVEQEQVLFEDIKSGKYPDCIVDENCENTEVSSDESKSKELRIIRLIVLLITTILFVKFAPNLLVKLLNNNDNDNEIQQVENQSSKYIHEWLTYSKEDFSFIYPSDYRITRDTILYNRHCIGLVGNNGILMIDYSNVPNEKEFTVEQKCDLCINEIEEIGKKNISGFSNDINYGDVKCVDNEGTVVKYILDFDFGDYRGFILSAQGDKIAYTATAISTNVIFLEEMSEIVERINAK